MRKQLFLIISILTIFSFSAAAQIQQIWLTHNKNSPDSVVVSWCSQNAGDSTVKIGTDKNNLQTYSLKNKEAKNLHHVEVELNKKDCTYFYQVETGKEKSEIYSFKGYPSKGKDLRVACIGNLGYLNPKKNAQLGNILESDPHLLVSCGDNVPALHLNATGGKPVDVAEINAFKKMIDRCPELFRGTIFMSILGNHDKEFRGRGKTRPDKDNPVYDIEASAYKKFFELPAPEWYWQFDFPNFDVKLVGLDLCHTTDLGTGWQACHLFDANSEQFLWYKNLMKNVKNKYVITFYNESNRIMRGTQKGIWEKELQRGSLVVSGFGYFMEYARLKNGMPYINNSLNTGDHYKDKVNAVFSEPIGGYLLMKFSADGKFVVELVKLSDNSIMFSQEIKSRISN